MNDPDSHTNTRQRATPNEIATSLLSERIGYWPTLFQGAKVTKEFPADAQHMSCRMRCTAMHAKNHQWRTCRWPTLHTPCTWDSHKGPSARHPCQSPYKHNIITSNHFHWHTK